MSGYVVDCDEHRWNRWRHPDTGECEHPAHDVWGGDDESRQLGSDR